MSDKDTDTGLRSAVKALGQNNPATLSAVWSPTKGPEVKGGNYIKVNKMTRNFGRIIRKIYTIDR